MTGKHDGVDATHLAGAHANGRSIFGVYDGVAFDMAADAPGEREIGQLFRIGQPFGYDAPVGRIKVLLAVV